MLLRSTYIIEFALRVKIPMVGREPKNDAPCWLEKDEICADRQDSKLAKGTSIYDVRTQGGEGGSWKSRCSKGGCVKMRTRASLGV